MRPPISPSPVRDDTAKPHPTHSHPFRAARRAPAAIALAAATVAFVTALGAVAPAAAAVVSASPQSQFDAANAAYKEQNYQAALDGYEKLIREGGKDPIVCYNAGCALAQLGQKGRAVAMFERALKLRPRFAEAEENLRRVGPPAPPSTLFFLLLPFRALFRAMTAEEFFLVAVAAYWVAALGGVFWIVLRSGRARQAAAWATCASLALGLFFGAFFLGKEHREKWVEAVVVADKALSRSGPSEKYSELDLLSEGVKVRLLGLPAEGWVKVQLPERRIGYLPENALEVI